MILVDVAIYFGVFAGIKAIEKVKAHKANRLKQFKKQRNMPEKIQNTENAPEQFYNHYLKVSTLAVGLTIISTVYSPIRFLCIGIYGYISFPIFRKANKTLKEQKFGNDTLTAILNTLCLITNQFFALALGVWLYYLGRKLLARTQDHSKKVLSHMFEKQPTHVWILSKEGVEIEIPLVSIEKEDIVVVKAGEVIPVDGLITQGYAMIDQQALTGEAQPAEKNQGEHVFASTIVMTGKVYIQVKKSGEETTVAKIGQMLEHSIDYKSTFQTKAEKWADDFALPIFGLGILSFPIIGVTSATSVLNAGFGNRIIAVAPFGVLNHIRLAAKQSILIKDGRALENFSQVDTIVFDKTGTLTDGELEVEQIISYGQYQKEDILLYTAAAEDKQTHPIAQAIVQKAKESNLVLPPIDDSQYTMGYGVTVTIEQRVVRVGSVRFMKLENMALPEGIEETVTSVHNKGHSLIMIAFESKVVGAIELKASIRPNIQETMAKLRQQGIKHLVIISGDQKQPTQKLAELLGMDDFYYEVLPADKANIIQQFQEKGHKVCFIGDGINDSVALKQADVSVSLKGASSIATDLAQVIFIDKELSNLVALREISNNLSHNLQTSLLINLIPTVLCIGGGFLLHFNALNSIIVNNIGLLAGFGNATFPLKKVNKLKPLQHHKNFKI